MSSGVTVSTEAKTVYDDVKKDKKFRYIIYHIKDDTVIDVESTGQREANYNEFLKHMQKFKEECRYCVFDFPANIPVEGGQEKTNMSVDRLILLRWCPEAAKVKQKMLYASSYESLKKALVGVYKYVQATDFEEASLELIEDTFRKGK